MEPIRIILVDDHTLVRAGLRMVIESHPRMSVVGEAGTAAEALAEVRRTAPDLVLLDLGLGDEDGLDLIPDLLAMQPATQVLVLTGLRDPEIHRQAVMRGAMGLVLKDRAVETVHKAIEKVCSGEAWFDRALIADVLRARVRGPDVSPEDPEAARIRQLTIREREVITLVCQGLRNRELAEQLRISEATVRHHLTSIFSKLGVGDRTELVLYAIRHRLVPPPS